MKKLLLPALCAIFILSSCEESMDKLTDRVFDRAVTQFALLDSQIDSVSMPRSLNEDGTLRTSPIKWWCAGFFPGSLWYTYEYTGNEDIKALALKNTEKIIFDNLHIDHDLGFVVWCSRGNALRLTGDENQKETIEKAAAALAARFSPSVGCIRSWNSPDDFLVIIDNMMNLELLEESAKLFNCDSLSQIARTHAYTTIKNHFRDDFSSYHLVRYNENDGSIKAKQTVQGYADESFWGRGQAWGLYGYTMMFRETGDSTFLSQAENIAGLIIPNLPEDGITYWDMSVPEIPNVLRDASAAAVMASAFVELSTFSKANSSKYLKLAEKILRTLASDEYLCKPGECCGFLLKHSVGHLPKNSEVDVPLTYADYYFLEALLRYKNLSK